MAEVVCVCVGVGVTRVAEMLASVCASEHSAQSNPTSLSLSN